jgi:hypothetical protein
MTRLQGRRTTSDWIFKIHRRMIKPPYPVLIFCPGCGHGLIEVNANYVEVDNSFGLSPKQLRAEDIWSRLKHSCGSTIVLYWKQ